jgi:hypothetical protein
VAPPQLKRLGRNIVRASDDVPVRLYGPHLFWFSHRASWPSATASTTELDWVDEVFGASTAGWGSSLATFWLSTIGTGKVNAAGTQTTTGEATWLAHVDGLVSRATTANTYVLFVWAVHEPQGTHDRIIDAEGIATLRFMARRFSGNPAVLLAIQAEVPFTDTTANRTALRAACVQAISQIRAEDPVMLIGIPGLNWSQRVQWFLDNPINDANLFVKPHLYEGSLSGGSMALTIVTSGAQAVYDAGWPIIVGECGVGSRSNAADLAYLFDHAETNIWGWQGWALMYGISRPT